MAAGMAPSTSQASHACSPRPLPARLCSPYAGTSRTSQRKRRVAARALLAESLALAEASQGLSVAGSAALGVQDQLQSVSPSTYLVVLSAGLVTSLSPCTLSILPLTLGYIGGYGDGDASPAQGGTPALVTRAIAFSLGLASSLAGLGLAASTLGRVYGQVGPGLPIAVSGVAIAMGLNLLGALPFRLPSANVDLADLPVPPVLLAYLAGVTFALTASPCSTPVLATLLAYASTSDNPLGAASLLFTYTCGYVAPLLTAAVATGGLKRVLALRQWGGWITPTSGMLLVSGGTYTLLSNIVPT